MTNKIVCASTHTNPIVLEDSLQCKNGKISCSIGIQDNSLIWAELPEFLNFYGGKCEHWLYQLTTQANIDDEKWKNFHLRKRTYDGHIVTQSPYKYHSDSPKWVWDFKFVILSCLELSDFLGLVECRRALSRSDLKILRETLFLILQLPNSVQVSQYMSIVIPLI